MKRAIKSALDVKPESLRHIRSLAKAKQRAGRFALFTDQLGKRLYVSKEREDFPLTFSRAEALEYYEGFDDPARLSIWWGAKFPTVLIFNAIQTKRPKYGKDKKQIEQA